MTCCQEPRVRYVWCISRARSGFNSIFPTSLGEQGAMPVTKPVRKHGYTAPYERAKVPGVLQGLNCLEAIRSEGPTQCFVPLLVGQIEQWQKEIQNLQFSLRDIQRPCELEEATREIRAGLTRVTKEWFDAFCENSFDLPVAGPLEDRWYDYLITWPDELDDWYGDELLAWGQHELPDLVATFVDGEAEGFADEAFYMVSSSMPRAQMRDRISFLQQRVAQGRTDMAQDV